MSTRTRQESRTTTRQGKRGGCGVVGLWVMLKNTTEEEAAFGIKKRDENVEGENMNEPASSWLCAYNCESDDNSHHLLPTNTHTTFVNASKPLRVRF